MNLSIEWSGFLDADANPVVYPYKAVDFPLVEVVLITTEKNYTFRFPAGYNISIDLKSMFYLYSISDNVYSSFPSTFIEFLYYRSDSPNPITAQPQPNERVTFDLTVQFPDPADFVYEPIEPMEPFEPLFTSAGFAYFGTLVVLPNTTKTFSTEAIALRLPINRSTGVDLNAQIDESGMYISPIDDSALLTTVISEQAEINFIKENVQLRILNPTDIVHFYESTKTYVVSNIFEFRAPVKYLTPYNTASFYENTQNVLLPIPLTGGEFDVNLITKMVTERDIRLYTEPSLNTSIAIITNTDGSVVPMLAETTSVYGYIPSVRGLFFVIGYDYFTPLEDVLILQPDPELEPRFELQQPETQLSILEQTIMAETTNTNTQPATTNTQPATTNTQPATTNTQPATTNTQPATTNTQPATTNTQPATTNTQPATTNTQPATQDPVVVGDLPTPDNAINFYMPEPETMNRGDPLRTPLPTERTVVDNVIEPADVQPADVVNEPKPVNDESNDKPTWFYPVVIIVPLVVIIAVIVGVVIYRKRSARAKKI